MAGAVTTTSVATGSGGRDGGTINFDAQTPPSSQRHDHTRMSPRKAHQMEQRVSLITLGVTDLGRARDFYIALGWTPAASPDDDVVFFQAGGLVLGLWSREQLAHDSAVRDSGGWGGVTLAYNVRSPAEVDAVIEEARAAGAVIGREPAPTFWGGYSGVFADPDGHPWEVAHNPGWALLADGSVSLSG
ncbi:MAG TPA: VOC family protein [Streptosporangiaceae bacterium]|nr:VOC family protein [Streptosporangiaceae bacterium]